MAEAIGGSTGNALPANPLLGTDNSTARVTGQSNTGPGVWGQSIGLVPPTPPGGMQQFPGRTPNPEPMVFWAREITVSAASLRPTIQNLRDLI